MLMVRVYLDSENNQAWPVLCTLHNFPLEKRRHFIILCSLWRGPGKRFYMNQYLLPFVEESKKLYSSGITFLDKTGVT